MYENQNNVAEVFYLKYHLSILLGNALLFNSTMEEGTIIMMPFSVQGFSLWTSSCLPNITYLRWLTTEMFSVRILGSNARGTRHHQSHHQSITR